MAEPDTGHADPNERPAAQKTQEARRRRDLKVAAWIVFGALAVFFTLSLLIWMFGLQRLRLG